jgi:hypothetical protein
MITNTDIKIATTAYKKVKLYVIENAKIKLFVQKQEHPTKGQKLDITV